ncbi:MAG: NAD(P)/FAD-dependent oxidoreductase, partial [Oscillospiraceae bacterium]|nr:NAD(P)/FAD-dependent oxidoreductase [Oscillospiraceae bacterium]
MYVDLKPALETKILDQRILRDFKLNINRDFINSLGALLPNRLIPIVVERSGILPHKKVNNISAEERTKLIDVIKHFRLSPVSPASIDEAIITAGGIAVDEVDPKTMMSKILPNIYFAGEVLDVDGYTGGFNLTIAFATGAAAGRHILKDREQ